MPLLDSDLAMISFPRFTFNKYLPICFLDHIGETNRQIIRCQDTALLYFRHSHIQPFNDPAVSPAMNSFCKRKKKASMGKAERNIREKIWP